MTAPRSLLSLGGSGAAPTSGASAIPRPPSRWKTRVLLPAVLGVGFVALFAAAARDALTPTIDVHAIPVVEKPGGGGTATSSPATGGAIAVQAAGWIEPSPYPTYVSALTDGVVADVLALEGESVTKGQPLARLVADDARIALRRAEAMLRQREAELAVAGAELAAARTVWDQNIERRRAADTAAAMDREKRAGLDEAKAEAASEKAMLVDAERAWKRAEELVGSGTLSEAEAIAAKAAYESRRATTDASERRVEMLAAQVDRAAAENDAERRELDLRTEDRLRLDGAVAAEARAQAEAEVAQAEVDDARLRVSRLEIVAPVDGVVMRRLVEPGSKIMVGMDDPWSAHVVHLYDPAHLQVRVDVPLADAGKVVVGQRVEASVEALPNRTFAGRVARIVNLADIQKNTLQAKVVLDDPDPALRPDMLARVKFLAGAATGEAASGAAGSLWVPTAALTTHGAMKMLWVVADFDGERGVASMRHLEAGTTSGDWVEIPEGLRAGDLVVVDPPSNLKDGARVRVLPAPAPKGGA